MQTKVQPEAPTASPAIKEQSVGTFFHVDIMNDLDDGHSTLAIATETNLGDLRETSHARARDLLADAYAKLDHVKRLIDEHEATTTLAAILAEHDLTLIEVDMVEAAAFFGELTPRLQAWSGREDGRLIVWVPKGQDPVERVGVVAALINNIQAQAAEAQA